MQNLTYYPPCNHKQNTPSCSASFPHRGTHFTQVADCDLAISYTSVLLALGAPLGARGKVSSPCYTTSLLGRQSQQDAPKSRTLRLRSALRRTSLCDVESPPTSALPMASTSFALATDNSQDCPLNASRRCGSNSAFEKVRWLTCNTPYLPTFKNRTSVMRCAKGRLLFERSVLGVRDCTKKAT